MWYFRQLNLINTIYLMQTLINKSEITGELLEKKMSLLESGEKRDLEAWVVNTVKVKMIAKLDSLLEGEGRKNLREVFLVPIFSIFELKARVAQFAPELQTLFFQELTKSVATLEKRLA